MKNRIAALVACLTILLAPHAAFSQQATTVIGTFVFTAVTDSSGQALANVTENDVLTLNADSTFTLLLAAKSTVANTGTWRLAGNYLQLNQTQPTAGIRNLELLKLAGQLLIFKEDGAVFSLQKKQNSAAPKFDKTGFSAAHFGRGLLGMFALLALAFLFSSNRKKIKWSLVLKGIGLQLILAIGILKVPFIEKAFDYVGRGFVAILGFTREGSLFLFGSLVQNTDSFGYIFAFQVLPTVVFFSALTSLLYYYNILQKVVFVFAWIMKRSLKISGAESLAAAANIFLGQTEAPLLVKPYIKNMTNSELLCLMTGGMATIAGGVLAAYIGYLGGPDPEAQLFFARHLLAASVMSAPAAIVAAKMLLPETEKYNEDMTISRETIGSNWLEAIANGTTDGLKLAVNVGAMLLVFTAMIYMGNAILGDVIGELTGLNNWVASVSNGQYSALSFQFILGYSLAPLTWLLGVNGPDITLVAQLLGEKTILNEFYAYVTMGDMIKTGAFVEQRSVIIATYILCGFANFASIGIQIGGISALAPNRRADLSRLGVRALIGGTIASLLTAVIVGMLI